MPAGTAGALQLLAASNWSQKSNATCGWPARGDAQRLLDEAEQRAGEILGPQAARPRRAATRRPDPAAPASDSTASMSAATCIGSLSSYSTPRAVHRRRHRGGGVGEHRHLLVERLDERHAEALVLARAQEQVGDLVVGDQLFVGHVADEVHVGDAERRRPAGAATRGSARSRCGRRRCSSRERGLNDRVVGVEEADQILDLLVRRSPGRRTGCWSTRRRTRAATQPVRRRRSRCEKSGTTGSTAGARKSERLEVLPVELRVAEREVAAVGVGAQLAAAAKALPRQRAVHADEILRRRDVVVDERHPIGQRERRARRLRAEREMMEQQVVADG